MESVAEGKLTDGSGILTVNTGSSSIKFTLYRVDGASEAPELSARAERIGAGGGRLRLTNAGGEARDGTVAETAPEAFGWAPTDLPDHAAALGVVLERMRRMGDARPPAAVGHRIVHGGSLYREPVEIVPEVVAGLRGLSQIDPTHMPQAIAAIGAIHSAYPAVPQVACFDTAFHAAMPRVARLFALPRVLSEEGIVRYGFHGLSYEYVTSELRKMDQKAAEGRIIIAHLGNGASMAAVRGGEGVDTTMGFTPTGGLMMGTRSGDLDPGVLLHLLRAKELDVGALDALVNGESGLLGVSETSADMRELLGREDADPRAAEAIAIFCYAAKKYLGSLAAALGGLETLVFTGGIGERAAPVRERICDGLAFLGIALDLERNAGHEPVVSSDGSPVTVRVLPTDENAMIARHTTRLIRRKGAKRVPF
jgi:acetate kinase